MNPEPGPSAPTEPVVGLPDLPDAVRQRVVAEVAAVLPDAGTLPPALRRVAGFAAARRARLGSGAVVEALVADDLRERLATLVAARTASQAGDRQPDGAADRAARAWLLREEDWEETLVAALEELGAAAHDPQREESRADRLARRLERVEQQLREARAAHRHDLDAHKAEVAALRRRIAEVRRGAPGEQVRAEALEALEAVEGVVAERDAARAEVERLAADLAVARERVELLERRRGPDQAAERRAARIERDDVTARARLLLDTVLDAAAGLRRELALPTVVGTPGERLETRIAESSVPTTAPGAVVPLTAPMVEGYLATPRSRLIVDGYNVSKSAWPAVSLEVQRARLLAALAPLSARTGVETTVVFDAADSTTRPPVSPPRGVRVLFSPPGVIADDVVGELAEAEPAGRVVLVATDDREVLARVARAGARGVPAAVLLDVVAR